MWDHSSPLSGCKGIEFTTPALEAWSLNHWTISEVPYFLIDVCSYHRVFVVEFTV